jgi:hypothetical protein
LYFNSCKIINFSTSHESKNCERIQFDTEKK